MLSMARSSRCERDDQVAFGFGPAQCPAALGTDRRTNMRYPIQRQLMGKVLLHNTETLLPGVTMNISSTGVSFAIETQIQVGRMVELLINWPALLNGNMTLNLIVRGRVVRSGERDTAIRIMRYEFRASGRTVSPLHFRRISDMSKARAQRLP